MNKTLIIIGIVVIAGILLFNFLSTNKNEAMDTAVQNVRAADFQQQLAERPGTIIDVRTQDEYDEGHLAETDQHLNLLNGDFEAALSSLDKDETYYLYCRSGNRSGQAARLMAKKGFENVYNIGGFQDLVDAGAKSKK